VIVRRSGRRVKRARASFGMTKAREIFLVGFLIFGGSSYLKDGFIKDQSA
jgi:hypothetical protein